MVLITSSGLQALTSVNCHCTRSSIHLQLNKGTKACGGWDEKVACLSHFVNHTLNNAVKQIEKADDFATLRELMRADLVDAKTQLANEKSKQPTVLGKHFTSLGTKLIDNKQGATPGVHPVILEPKLPTNLSKTLSTSNGAKPNHDSETPQVVEIPQVVGISQEYDQESSINVSDLHPQ